MAATSIPILLRVLLEKDPRFGAKLKEVQAELEKVGAGSGSLDKALGAVGAGGEKALAKVAREAEEVQQELRGAEAAAKKAEGQLRETGQAGTRALHAVGQEAREADAALGRVEKTTQGARKEFSAAARAALAMAQATNRAVTTTQAQPRQAPFRVFGEKDSLNAVAEDVRSRVDASGGALRDLGDRAALALAGIAAGLTAVSAATVKVAADFELLRAKLETVRGSAKEADEVFRSAVEFAAKTPFDVGGIVTATVQLEVYGQRSEEVLPLVADLAAGMGKRIEDTALVVGKALSGSLEGFESLRNEYGISLAKLAQYGAELSSTGGIAVRTASQMDKARNALTAIIETEFGGAIERQSKTIVGALSNAKDAAINLAAGWGDTLVPAVTLGAQTFSSIANTLNAIPGPLKAVGAAAAVLTAGISGVGAVALFAATRIGGLAIALDVMAASSMPAVSGAAQTVQARVEAASESMQRFRASAAGANLAFAGWASAVGLAAGALGTLAIEYYRGQIDAMSRSIDAQSSSLRKNVSAWRQVLGILEQVGIEAGEVTSQLAGAGEGPDAGRILADFAESIRSAPLAELFAAAGKAGYESFGQIKQGQEEATQAFDQGLDRVNQLRELLALVKKQETNPSAAFEIDDLLNKFPDLRKEFKDTGVTVDAVRMKFESAQGELSRARTTKTFLDVAADRLAGAGPKLDEAIEGYKRLNDLLRFSESRGDAETLTRALEKGQAAAEEMRESLRDFGLPTDTQELIRILDSDALQGQDNPLRPLVEGYLELTRTNEEVADQVRSVWEEAQADAAQVYEERIQREKALGELSLAEEKRILEEELAAVVAVREEEGRSVEEMGQTEIRVREKLKDAATRLRQEQVRAAQEALQGEIAPLLAKAEEAEAADQGAQAVSNAYARVVRRIKEWQRANQYLIEQFPELGNAAEEALDSAADKQAAAARRAQSEAFQDLQEQIRDAGREADSTADQLDAVRRGIELVAEAERTGSITMEDALRARNQLRRQEADLVDRVRQEQERLAQQAQQQVLQGLDQQIQLLEYLEQRGGGGAGISQDEADRLAEQALTASSEELASIERKLAAGSEVEEELAELRRERHEEALELLELEKEAAIAAAGEAEEQIAAIEERYRQDKRQLEEAERLRVLRAIDAEARAVEAAEERKAEARRKNRLGGERSPLQSIEEAFGEGSLSFRLPDFSFSAPEFRPEKKGQKASQDESDKGEKKLGDESEDAAEKVDKLGSEAAKSGSAIGDLAPPAQALGVSAREAAPALVALGSAASGATAALQDLARKSGGGEGRVPPPEADSSSNSEKKAKGDEGSPKPPSSGDGDEAAASAAGILGRAPRFPTPKEMGAIPLPRPQPANVRATENIRNEVTQILNLDGVRQTMEPDAQAIGQAVERYLARRFQRDKVYRGPAT